MFKREYCDTRNRFIATVKTIPESLQDKLSYIDVMSYLSFRLAQCLQHARWFSHLTLFGGVLTALHYAPTGVCACCVACAVFTNYSARWRTWVWLTMTAGDIGMRNVSGFDSQKWERSKPLLRVNSAYRALKIDWILCIYGDGIDKLISVDSTLWESWSTDELIFLVTRRDTRGSVSRCVMWLSL